MEHRILKSIGFIAGLLLVIWLFSSAHADYLPTLPEIGTGEFMGEQGGLYPNGQNEPPIAYLQQLENVDCSNGNGQVIIVGLGMSMMQNALSGWENYLNLPEVNDNLVLINGAIGSNQQRWQDENYFGWSKGLQALLQAGYTTADVKCIMYHNAWSGPSGDFVPYAEMVKNSFAITMDIIQDKYPNVEMILINSRHYGLSPTSKQPEPYAFYEGWSVKWLIKDRINCVVNCGALLAWNAYQWKPEWIDHPEYYVTDGLHLSQAGQNASGQIWHDYLANTSFTAGWYLDGTIQPTATAIPEVTPTATPFLNITPTVNPEMIITVDK